VIERNKAGEFVAKFKYNAEIIFWTEGYSSKASAKNAIESIQKNDPARPLKRAEPRRSCFPIASGLSLHFGHALGRASICDALILVA